MTCDAPHETGLCTVHQVPKEVMTIDEILNKILWGDYQDEVGNYRRGIANRLDIKAALEQLIREARIDEAEKALSITENHRGDDDVSGVALTLYTRLAQLKAEH